MEEERVFTETTKNNIFERKLKKFFTENKLNLEIETRVETVETLINSKNKEQLDNYIIANDFKLKTESSSITLAYKNNGKDLLVVKEMTEEEMNNLIKLHNWGNLTVEEYLREQKFSNEKILLPVEIIKKNRKIYRFYQAMDINLEEYLETHNQLTIKDGISLIIHACNGISALNKAGIANIDFAPLNTMLTKTDLKLIDLDGASIDINNDGVFSRNYGHCNRFTSAPELFEEKPIFNKTVDVYAASINLYRLLVGNWPYDIENQTNNLPYEEKMAAYKRLHKEWNINFPEFIPMEIQEIIKKGVNPNPENRYQSIEEFMSDLLNIFNKLEQKFPC
jgi:serine/threonine protein kinase